MSRLQLEAREEITVVDAPPYIGGQSNPNDHDAVDPQCGPSARDRELLSLTA
ncbi:hypothetical protein [Streptomyces sp. V1I6]|uniref:hypothetical protein n=1 Tax=Streptomyces sp. V1I6 TaxID=3042273 RepID=UPI0027D7CBAA|nr:hypothetical protein [Streptomyces sp. V1I6]